MRVEFNENNNVADNSIRRMGAIRSARQSPVWLVSLTVIAVYICFIDRVAISIAIIPMAAENAWSASTQGAIMAAFFLGYLTLQIPAGLLADRFGGKWVLGLGVLLWSVFTLLTPPAAAAGLVTLVACRFFMGVAEAVTWPSIYSLYSQWVSDARRATAVGFMNSGVAGGSVIALVATPLLVAAYSWQLAFYIYGAIGVVWFLIWTPTTQSSPASTANTSRHEHRGAKFDFPKITLSALLRSRAVWAIAVAHMCLNWTIFLMLSWLPTYINKGLGADFSQIGMLAVAPAVVAMLLAPVAGRVFDSFISRGFNRLRVRKVMQSLAFGSIALTFAILGYIESVMAGVLLVTFSNAMTACSVGGFATNHLEIAPNQSGLLMGVTNTLGSLSSGLAILISGIVLDVTGSWVAVFQLAAAIAMLGAVFYWRFASIEREFY